MYRLAAVSIHLPPLRQRPDDILPLCDYFLRRIGDAGAERSIGPTLAAELQQRPWFGNVRELRNAIEHASVIARGRPLELSDFPSSQRTASITTDSASRLLDSIIESWTRRQLQEGGDEMNDLHDRMLSATEPALLRVILERTGGNRAAAAQLLGMHRGTLRERMKRYDWSTDD